MFLVVASNRRVSSADCSARAVVVASDVASSARAKGKVGRAIVGILHSGGSFPATEEQAVCQNPRFLPVAYGLLPKSPIGCSRCAQLNLGGVEMDIFTQLKTDHDQVKALFRKIEQAAT